jgi:hypothetical protein
MAACDRLGMSFIVVVFCFSLIVVGLLQPHIFAKNPDPNHIHADFAIWMDGKELDFAAQKYMTTESLEASLPKGDLRKYVHLHDGNGHVIHVHKPGITFGQFLETLGMKLERSIQENGNTLQVDCFEWTTDMRNLRCSGEEGAVLHMFVNGKDIPVDPSYVLHDSDQILLIHSRNEAEVQRALNAMTDDACLYSKTCPWRGKAPTEGCIADPSVPCGL